MNIGKLFSKAVQQVQHQVNAVTGSGITGQELNIGGTRVIVGEKLAEGGFGCVYRATDNYGKVYAVKSLQAPDEEHYNQIMAEYEIQKICSAHPNVVKVFGMSSERGSRNVIILMEFCSGECVKEMNQCFSRGFDTRKIIEIFSSVCDAVNFMHEQKPGISHRDLKVENILCNGGIYKLCDFGSATRKVYTLDTNEERNEAGDDIQRNTTATYRAPEMCDLYRRHRIDTKADVWALGCVLFKLCTFKDAFPDGSNLQILNCRYSWPSDRSVDDRFKKIVEICFTSNPSERPTVRQVMAALQKSFPDMVDRKWAAENMPAPAPSPTPVQQPQIQQNSNTFDPFSGQGQFQGKNQSNTFDPFAGQSQAQPQNTFDPFAGQTQASQSPQLRKNSTSDMLGSGSSFDPFGSGASQISQPSNTFNPFGSAQQPAPSPVSSSTFDPFSTAPKPQFTPFAQSGQPQKEDGSLIDFGGPSNPPAAVEDFVTVKTAAIDVSRVSTDPDGLCREVLQMGEFERGSALFALHGQLGDSDIAIGFYFRLILGSGTKAHEVLRGIPRLQPAHVNSLVDGHRSFAASFPQFEGNFSLGAFMAANRAHPPPVGHPPISADVAKALTHMVGDAVAACRACHVREVGEHAFCLYQATAYVLAKLTVFKVNPGYVSGTLVPQLRNHHSQLKRALEPMGVQFPAEPFDFESQDFLKRIRAPASKAL